MCHEYNMPKFANWQPDDALVLPVRGTPGAFFYGKIPVNPKADTVPCCIRLSSSARQALSELSGYKRGQGKLVSTLLMAEKARRLGAGRHTAAGPDEVLQTGGSPHK
jgi:hypothetical protein